MKFNVQNLEKYITGFAYAIVVLSVVYIYLTTKIISPDAIYFSTITGSLFLGRKIASYVKPSSYSITQDGVVPSIPSPVEQNQNQTNKGVM